MQLVARNMIIYEIETCCARIAIEELLHAEPGEVPWQAAEFLKFEPTFVKSRRGGAPRPPLTNLDC